MNDSPTPFFVKRDLDGFFGLFIDNLVQLLVITELTVVTCGFDRSFVYSRVLPGAALSVLLGNIFYALQGRALARREGRSDVTALPYGINTPSVMGFIFFIMAPIYARNRAELGDEAASRLAWQIGMIACLGSGLIELGGSLVAERVRRATPRAALLAALAGIAIGFISMDFVLQIFEHPLLAIVPLGIILMQYFSGVRLPGGIPAGVAALLVGTALGWGIKGLTLSPIFDSFSATIQAKLLLETASMPDPATLAENLKPVMALPIPALDAIVQVFTGPHFKLVVESLGIIVPMGLFNLVGSLQNIESAEAAGDRFPTRPSLAVNGAGSILAALFGSCFPTTIYIGHVGWKNLGARTGYSALNGLVIAFVCFTGLIKSIAMIIPIESVIGILLWIALVIVAQAFQTVPRRHAPAVALGLIPAIAAWGLLLFNHGLGSAGAELGALGLEGAVPQAHLGGLIGLERGFILTSMCLAALGVMMIERRLELAARWAWVLAALSFFGVTHGWNPGDLGEPYSIGFGAGWRFALAYLLWGLMLYSLRRRTIPLPDFPDDP